jgi:hypothetical protein
MKIRPTHAAVTVGAHRMKMDNAPDDPDLGRVGAIVLRVWQEGSGSGARLRIRLVGREDVTQDVEDVASASTIEDALAHVRDWLEQFSLGPAGPGLAQAGPGWQRGGHVADPP